MTPLLCAWAVVITLETKKCWEKALHVVKFNILTNHRRQKRFCRMKKEEGQMYRTLPTVFLPQDLTMIFRSLVIILPRFRLWKAITKSWTKTKKSEAKILQPQACWTSVPNFMEIIQELKVKFNLASMIELSETADFVYNFVWKPYTSEQIWLHFWPTFRLNLFLRFSQKMPLYGFYTMAQKSQNDQKLKSRAGSCLTFNGSMCLCSTFFSLEGDHHCACAQKWCNFSFFQDLSNKSSSVRPIMTKIASRGPSLIYYKPSPRNYRVLHHA